MKPNEVKISHESGIVKFTFTKIWTILKRCHLSSLEHKIMVAFFNLQDHFKCGGKMHELTPTFSGNKAFELIFQMLRSMDQSKHPLGFSQNLVKKLLNRTQHHLYTGVVPLGFYQTLCSLKFFTHLQCPNRCHGRWCHISHLNLL